MVFFYFSAADISAVVQDFLLDYAKENDSLVIYTTLLYQIFLLLKERINLLGLFLNIINGSLVEA